MLVIVFQGEHAVVAVAGGVGAVRVCDASPIGLSARVRSYAGAIAQSSPSFDIVHDERAVLSFDQAARA
jgi:hypothetical protein